MMLSLKTIDLRKEDRKKPTGLIPGFLRSKTTGTALSAKTIDISTHGFGVLIEGEHEVGDILEMIYRGRTIELVVVWCRTDLARQKRFRYGLEVVDKNIDLEQIFIEAGCLK